MTIKERLTQFIQYKGISMGAFERACSLSNGFVCKVGDSIRRAKLENISAIYPELNTNWLLTGVGSMLNEEESKDTYINKVEEVQATIPLVPLSAMAGKLTGFSLEGITETDCERIISPIKGVDFAVPVSGESMSPIYPNGSRVLVQEIDPNSFIEWGKVYVLNTCNGIIIKQLRKSEKEGYVSCYSYNDNNIYAPFDIPTADIYGWYKVLMCLSLQ